MAVLQFTNTISTILQKQGICIVSFTYQSKYSSKMRNEAHAHALSPSTTPLWTRLQTRNGVSLHLQMQGAVHDQLVTKRHKLCAIRNRPIAGLRLVVYCSRQIPDRIPRQTCLSEKETHLLK